MAAELAAFALALVDAAGGAFCCNPPVDAAAALSGKKSVGASAVSSFLTGWEKLSGSVTELPLDRVEKEASDNVGPAGEIFRPSENGTTRPGFVPIEIVAEGSKGTFEKLLADPDETETLVVNSFEDESVASGKEFAVGTFDAADDREFAKVDAACAKGISGTKGMAGVAGRTAPALDAAWKIDAGVATADPCAKSLLKLFADPVERPGSRLESCALPAGGNLPAFPASFSTP
jgi:hypothetical protein